VWAQIFAQNCEKMQFLANSAKNCKKCIFPKLQKTAIFLNEKVTKRDCDFYRFLTKYFGATIFRAFVYIVTCDWISLQPIRKVDSILTSSQIAWWTYFNFYSNSKIS